MAKIKSLDELMKIKANVQNSVDLREKGENVDSLVQVKVAMATCGIAAGAREVMDFIIEDANKKGIENIVVTQTGCMGYCYAEPTVEITLPQKEPVVFGHVKKEKAREIIDVYIKRGELVDGIIPVNFKTIDD